VGELDTSAIAKCEDVGLARISGCDGGVVSGRGNVGRHDRTGTPRTTNDVGGGVPEGIGSVPRDGTLPSNANRHLSPG